MPLPSLGEIRDYYDFSKVDYQIYNLSRTDIAMHYGLWDLGIKTHRQALMNENRVVAASATVSKRDIVLDAGCGYGSSAIWMARNIGCKVIGITLSSAQVGEAERLATAQGVEHLVSFVQGDFHQLPFGVGTFDAVIAIRKCLSFC